MKSIQRRTVLTALGLCAGGGSPTSFGAGEWAPTKVVKIIVPIVGSTNDTLARLVANRLQDVLGQSVIVENKGGAGGSIGAYEVVKAAPDGHTLLVGFNGPIAINKTLFKSLPYDPEKDLAPITLAVSSPQFLVVHPGVPANNVAELVALSKKRNLSYASVSVGSASHLTMEMLKSATGVTITHVPYKGATQAVVDLVGGVVDAAFLVPGNILQFVQEGKARVIATTGARRFQSMPQVATMIEQGYPEFIATSWIGFLAPGKTPPEIISRYNKEMVKILQLPDVRAQLEKMEFEVVAGSPEQFASWIKAEVPRWGAVIKATGATAD